MTTGSNVPELDPEPVLSFEEFSARTPLPRYGNLHMFFSGGTGDIYRQDPYYQRFAAEHPELDRSLKERVPTRDDRRLGTSESLKPFDDDFYEFYLAMRSYGASDRDVFD